MDVFQFFLGNILHSWDGGGGGGGEERTCPPHSPFPPGVACPELHLQKKTVEHLNILYEK